MGPRAGWRNLYSLFRGLLGGPVKPHRGRIASPVQKRGSVTIYTKNQDLWTRVRELAAREEKPLAHVVEELIIEGLRERDKT